MRAKRNTIALCLCASFFLLAACEDASTASPGEGNGDADADGDTDGDTDSDADSDSDSDGDPSGSNILTGTVRSATGFPIPGALVYLTYGSGSVIPDNAYCYECEDMTGKVWTLSNPDGTWTIDTAPAGTMNIVTRKGFFQRQRQIDIDNTSEVQIIPDEITTLPGDRSEDGLDQIPNYAVLLNTYDLAEDMLAKMGMGEVGSAGHLIDGTQTFDLYNDNILANSPTAVGNSTLLLSQQANLDHYHMIFFPCTCNTKTAANHKAKLVNYVAGGGKIYASCWASQWAEQPFPDVIEFNGSDTPYNAGDQGFAYDTNGSINDPDMAAWLQVVAPGENLSSYPFHGAWVVMDGVNEGTYSGHGVDAEGVLGGPVLPTVWVTDVQEYAGSPLTVTYAYDCGKVFYSSYQVVESTASSAIRPQEWVLIYLFYEVGVCEGEYVPID